MVVNLVSNWFFPSEFGPSGALEKPWGRWVIDAAYFVPVPALMARRFHDQDRSAFWVLLAISIILSGEVLSLYPDRSVWLTLIGALPLLAVMGATFVVPGTAGINRFGPDPRVELMDQAPEDS